MLGKNLAFEEGTLKIRVIEARKLEIGHSYFIKVRYEGLEDRTNTVEFTGKSTSFSDTTFRFVGASNAMIKLAVLREIAMFSPRGLSGPTATKIEEEEDSDDGTPLSPREGDKLDGAEVVGRLQIDIKELPKHGETMVLKKKLGSRVCPGAMLTIEASFTPNTGESKAIRPIAKYSMLEDLLINTDLIVVKAICDNTTIINLEEVATSLVRIFAWNSSALELVRFASKKELSHTQAEEVLFREQTVYTKILSEYAMLIGKRYLEMVLGPVIKQMAEVAEPEGISFEVDPSRGGKVTNNRQRLLDFTHRFIRAILSSREILPPSIAETCRHLARIVEPVYPKSVNSTIGGYLFLRYICPAVVTPDSYGIVDFEVSSTLRRGLVLCAKLLQNLASGVLFGDKESYMSAFNQFLESQITKINGYFEAILREEIGEFYEEEPPPASEKEQIHIFYEIHKFLRDQQPQVQRSITSICIAEQDLLFANGNGEIAHKDSSKENAGEDSNGSEKKREKAEEDEENDRKKSARRRKKKPARLSQKFGSGMLKHMDLESIGGDFADIMEFMGEPEEPPRENKLVSHATTSQTGSKGFFKRFSRSKKTRKKKDNSKGKTNR